MFRYKILSSFSVSNYKLFNPFKRIPSGRIVSKKKRYPSNRIVSCKNPKKHKRHKVYTYSRHPKM